MRGLLSNMGRAALIAFVAAVWPLIDGFLSAPDLNQARLLAVPLLVAGFDAAFKAVQVFFPMITTGHAALDTLIRTGLAALTTYLPGVYLAPDLNAARTAFMVLVTGVSAALIRSGVALLTKGETITGKPVAVGAGMGSSAGFYRPDSIAPPSA